MVFLPGAIDKLPVRVPHGYAKPAITDVIVARKLQIIPGPFLNSLRACLTSLKQTEGETLPSEYFYA
jgi:hypothetical protein